MISYPTDPARSRPASVRTAASGKTGSFSSKYRFIASCSLALTQRRTPPGPIRITYPAHWLSFSWSLSIQSPPHWMPVWSHQTSTPGQMQNPISRRLYTVQIYMASSCLHDDSLEIGLAIVIGVVQRFVNVAVSIFIDENRIVSTDKGLLVGGAVGWEVMWSWFDQNP